MSETQTIRSDPATSGKVSKKTEVGSVFVSNYPAYSFWKEKYLPQIESALNEPAEPETPLGLYLHIPFCRKRCKFCYFKVYTGKNSNDIQTYLDALAREIEIYSEKPAIRDRLIKYVYFGGGTPSFISAKHLEKLVDRIKRTLPWHEVEEATFECEPGTLTQSKLAVIKDIGITRLSLGIENFSDEILKENGRAHLTKEINRVKPWIDELDFDQLNIDLIAGMVGETWESWKETVQRAIEFDADCVTIYQMELPFNTVYSKEIIEGNRESFVADWGTKRDWNDYAFEELSKAGYEISSAYTMVKKNSQTEFVYRDALWHGSDMIAGGVAAFGHMSGVHFQNVSSWSEYIDRIESGELALNRAFKTSRRDRLTRELILQMKLGIVVPEYFKRKFDVDILDEFSQSYEALRTQGMLDWNDSEIRLTRKGLLRVDQLLPNFYEEKYRNSRYT